MTGRDNSYTLNRIRMKHVHIHIEKIMYFSNEAISIPDSSRLRHENHIGQGF